MIGFHFFRYLAFAISPLSLRRLRHWEIFLLCTHSVLVQSAWHAHSDSGGRDELWQVLIGDSHAHRTSERATQINIL